VVWEKDDAQEIQLHLCDVFFVELYLSCGSEVPSEALFKFADVFVNTLERTHHSTLKARVFECVRMFIDAASYCSPKLAPKNRRGLDNDKDMFPDMEFVKVKLDDLEKWLMERASRKGDILNRDQLYALHDLTLKKQRAEPGFKLLPRGKISHKMAEVEEQEYKRLMDEHEKSKRERGEVEEKVLSKEERQRERKRRIAEIKKEALERKEKAEREKEERERIREEKEKEKVEDITGAEEPEKKKKKKNKNKKKVEQEGTTPSKTVTTVVKEVKKIAKGEVVGRSEEKIETVIIDDGKIKTTEVTTTTKVKEVRKAKEGGKEGEKKEITKPIPNNTNNTNGKNKRKSSEPSPSPAPSSSLSPSPSPANGKANDKKRKLDTSEVVAETQNGKGKKGKKAEEEKVEEKVVESNGKGKKGKKEIEERVEEVVVETTPKGKGKKGKKEIEVAEAAIQEVGITPKGKGKGKKGSKKEEEKETTNVTPTSGKKAVRFSSENLIKEFDKSKAVATSPSTSSPATTPVKLKSLLTPKKK